ncbi:hypothetical protein MXD62_36290 [Frankia sp. Mgl5]|uniref:hypothetical protein n=1 Tax=Frankia sp. Mgl5 TaxID=2933793 RepID=UPI00200DC17B|nr:hypothetical protein [Frankia sp. Mgl5]MCK9932540.1 hypothetical protein [Frankia sp. Mgl5]
MTRPRFLLACCLCRRTIPPDSDAYALDREWVRRFPLMVGTIACPACALHDFTWGCHNREDQFVEGHLPVADGGPDIDSWSHIEKYGSQGGIILTHPESGLLQGAEDYLRHIAGRQGLDAAFTRRLQAALDAWDAYSSV